MALGIPVIARLDPIYKSARPDVPILNADPNSLANQLKFLVQNREFRQRLALEGRSFVEKWHDSQVVAKRLIELYLGEFRNRKTLRFDMV